MEPLWIEIMTHVNKHNVILVDIMKYIPDFKEYRIHILIFTFAGSNTEAQAFLSRGGQIIIRMRGLPFTATAQQVVSSHLAVVLCMFV